MKRTPMQRSTPLRNTKPLVRQQPMRASGKVQVLRPRMCEVCRVKFRPARDNVTWCSPDHGAEVALRRVAADAARKHKEKLADIKPLQHWLKATERVVNHFVLTRDHDKPCISCGTCDTVQWEAGHYLSVGSHPELRFDLANIHKQCHRCNHNQSGNQAAYRLNLVPRIGQAEVDRLEGPHPTAKYMREALAQLRRDISRRTRELKKGRP